MIWKMIPLFIDYDNLVCIMINAFYNYLGIHPALYSNECIIHHRRAGSVSLAVEEALLECFYDIIT